MSTTKPPMFELVLPCFNESQSLAFLVNRTIDSAITAGFTCDNFKLILVDNGSSDDSGSIMDSLAMTESGKWFRKVTVKINQGYGFGIFSGLRTTTADFVGWSHADQQCDPTDAFKALKTLQEAGGRDTLVKGVRSGRGSKEIFVSRVFELFARTLLGLRVYELNAQPKIFPRALVSCLKNPPKTFAFDLYVLFQAAKAGYRFIEIPVLFPPRSHGVSRWAYSLVGRYKTILGIIAYMWHLRRNEGRL